MSTQKTLRIQFEIPLAMAKEIERLESDADIASHREFFSNMLALWRWAARRAGEGKIIASIHPQKLIYNEITLPALDSIRLKALANSELNLAGLTNSQPEQQ